jgi:hypothetical protein
MNDLLNLAVEAHGGLKRWSRVEAVTAAASITGEIWRVKSKPDYLKKVIFKVETKRERVTMDFPGQDKRSVFEPNRVEMQRRDGTVVATRDDPEASFQGHDKFTPWDDIHVAYLAERRSTPIATHRSSAPTTDFPVKKFLPFKLTPRPGAA